MLRTTLWLAWVLVLFGPAARALAEPPPWQPVPGKLLTRWAASAEPRSRSGIYPHLAMFNQEGECGTGAVVPWADRLWVITYAPHKPLGSTDKLYEITAELQQIIRPESVGGTPANRMIHRETQQLCIGPYVIDAAGRVRVIPPARMPGRLTGNARHLQDPARKVYYATMEEGLYEVDLPSLAVRCLIQDGNVPAPERDGADSALVGSKLAGYHGKGLYSGQGRVIYANNGEHGRQAQTDPTTPSGALAEWHGSGDWQLVRRNQFTEVTGPGGLEGNPHPETDCVWSIGWDARSLILMLLDGGRWHAFRLPKASHCYDGAHGWNTEWPRIREIGEPSLLMTMHGTFWRFPPTFSAADSSGIAPRSSYLKVIGDFCRWRDQLVFGCDDAARSEFLNKRRAKGSLAGAGQSQSNLWFVAPARLDQLGPPLGRGAVWLDDQVPRDTPSDPFLFAGFDYRTLHLAHDGKEPVVFSLEVDARGDGDWRPLRSVEVPAQGYAWTEFTPAETGAWIRLRSDRDVQQATAFFHFRNRDSRATDPADIFAGLAETGDTAVSGGLLHARGADFRTLRCIASRPGGTPAVYDLDGQLQLRPADDPQGLADTSRAAAIPTDVLIVDDASVLYLDDAGRRWRLPKGDAPWDRPGPLGAERICREVCTERDLLHAHGTFYELPAENAGGVARMRPVASHNYRIQDYASYRGLLVLSGVRDDAAGPHIIRSEDGRCGLWVGVVDDLWQLGKPRGRGGPWHGTSVQAGQPSDPYLMTGYDRKQLTLTHDDPQAVTVRVEVDVAGTGRWQLYRALEVPAGQGATHTFPEAFAAYWVRLLADRDVTATATFTYE